MNKQKPLGLFKKLGLGLLGAGLLAIVAYFAVVRPLQIRHQKQQFTKAEASLDQLYNQIIAKVGKPDQYKKEKSCSRAHLKSERGPLGCDVTLSILYANKNSQVASSIMTHVSSIGVGAVRSSSGIVTAPAFAPAISSKDNQTFYQNLKPANSLGCSVSYRYPANPGAYIAPSKNETENIEIHMGCGGPAMAEFYPVKN